MYATRARGPVSLVPPSVLCRRSSAVSIFDVFWEWFVDYHWYIWGLNTGRREGGGGRSIPFARARLENVSKYCNGDTGLATDLLMCLLTASSFASDLTADQQRSPERTTRARGRVSHEKREFLTVSLLSGWSGNSRASCASQLSAILSCAKSAFVNAVTLINEKLRNLRCACLKSM